MTEKKAIAYRRGSHKDRTALQQLRIDAYGGYAAILTAENAKILNDGLHNEATLDELMARATVFVATHDEQVVGMAFVWPSGVASPVLDADWAQLRMVGVHPHYRGQGIARMLTQMCIHHAILSNEHTLALHTAEFMDAARHIYGSLGFKILREIDPIFGKRYWVYTLTLKQKEKQAHEGDTYNYSVQL